MTAKHETIHIGDSHIRGEVNDQITWKLEGEGFTTFEPVVSGTLTFTGPDTPVTAAYRILALGNMRMLEIDPFTWGAITTPAQLVSGAIPLAHRPAVRNMTTTVGQTSTGEYLFIFDVETTGVVTIRGNVLAATGWGIQLLSSAGTAMASSLMYSVA
jgi:hypothetical protein